MRKSSGCLSGSAGLTTMATPTARIAAARRSTWPAVRTVRRAGAAKPAARISASRAGRCSRSTRCRCGRTSWQSRSSPMRSRASRMLALSRDLGTQYKTAFVLAHKMREAMAAEVRQTAIGGEGKRAEVDGGYFGGYVKPANNRENRKDRRLRQQPVRQAQGRGRDPRARRQDASRRVPQRGRCAHLHSPAGRATDHAVCRRSR